MAADIPRGKSEIQIDIVREQYAFTLHLPLPKLRRLVCGLVESMRPAPTERISLPNYHGSVSIP